MKSVNWSQYKNIHIYTALTPIHEVDTTLIHNYVAARHPSIKISTSPARKNAKIPMDTYDLIFVPVLGFDKHNNRLGMGGGWYDRFLARQTHAKKIGLAYQNAKLANLPVESHDVALDEIITDG